MKFFLSRAPHFSFLPPSCIQRLVSAALLMPLMRQTNGIMASKLARFVVRFAWHLTSLSWLVLAVILLALEFQPGRALRDALLATGAPFTAAGVFDALGSRGKHIGWPLPTAIGIASLLAAATG